MYTLTEIVVSSSVESMLRIVSFNFLMPPHPSLILMLFHGKDPGAKVNTNLAYSTVLHLKPVHFAGEFFTVLEHGRRANLSICRLTQETGAASSFSKVAVR